MSVACNPLLHLDGEPKGVDTEGDAGEQPPNDVVTEELSAGSVKLGLATVDEGVAGEPTLLDAQSPGQCDAECDSGDETLQKGDTDEAYQSACEFRFHFRNPPFVLFVRRKNSAVYVPL